MAATLAMSLLLAAPPASASLSTTPDITWMTNGAVYAIVRYGGYVYIGGQFTLVRQSPPGTPGPRYAAQGLARIDATTGVGDPTWTPDVTGGTNSRVYALTAAGGEIWVGGDFTAVDGEPRTNFAAVDAATGQVEPDVTATVGAPGSGFVRALTSSSSMVYVGGFFKHVDGKPRKRLAAFQLDGTLDPTWRPRADARVFSLAFDCSGATIFAGGQFRTAAGSDGVYQPRETVARFDPNTGALLPWAIPTGTIGLDQKAYDMAPTCTQLNVAYGKNNYAAAFALNQGDTGTQLWRDSTSGNVQTIATLGAQAIIGGHFTTVKKETRVRIAAVNLSDGSLDPDWHPSIEGQFFGPWDLLVSDNHLYVGGAFTSVAGAPQYFFARFTF